MKISYQGISLLLQCLLSFTLANHSQYSPDVSSMQALKSSLRRTSGLNWSDPDPCKWSHVQCFDHRVTHIEIYFLNLEGSLPPDLKNLSMLIILDAQFNNLTGPIPSLSGLSFLQEVRLGNNRFSYIPSDFFEGLTSLQTVDLDGNQFSSWKLPESLTDAKGLQIFSASSANISGTIPDFLGADAFPELMHLDLSGNSLQGQILSRFANSLIESIWLDGLELNGSLAVVQSMTSLQDLVLDGNHFTGPFPDLSRLTSLTFLSVSGNQITGVVPLSLINLSNLTTVNLDNNLLQGPTPVFDKSKDVDLGKGTNSFCLDDPGVACDSRVNILLSIAEAVGYPLSFARSWKGNDPCDNYKKWIGISCDDQGNITVVTFQDMGLSGKISPIFSMLTSLKRLILSDNSLTGVIPDELTTLPSLEILDVSNNHLHGEVPNFRQNVAIHIDGNPDILPPTPNHNPNHNPIYKPKNPPNIKMIAGSVIGAVFYVFIICSVVLFYTMKRKRFDGIRSSNTQVKNRPREGDENEVKITASYFGRNSDRGEFGNMIIPLQVLRNVTNNFSEENILGRGGFGTVYKGEFHDGTKIAVKKMESGMMSEQGLEAFKSEIEVLTKVRHRHLLALLGYYLDENEGLLVYEYMPQGTLTRYLFKWKDEGLKPLEWSRRLTIALDVARGVEYLHDLANQSFIHRDLKPSNILLGDDMQAKVADFGLVRLIPDNIKSSIKTRLAGTFGYLAPEYVMTGRVTKKVDVYSFGVILMELITGKRAVDATDPEDVVHLVTWFRNMYRNHDALLTAIDQTIDSEEKIFASIIAVAELADHCCAKEPQQRPDMNHIVNVLLSVAEPWTPPEIIPNDPDGIGISMTSLTPKSNSSATVSLEEPHCSLHS